MNDESAAAGDPGTDEDELFRRLTEMLSPQHNPPASVTQLAKQSFGLRTVDAELAALVADSEVHGTAAPVRGRQAISVPRLLTYQTAGLLVELEIGAISGRRRILGELLPEGEATIEVRQPGAADSRFVDVDNEGRFVVDGLRTGPFSLTCRRPGRNPVTTEWTSLD
jgi:hypothetical protein